MTRSAGSSVTVVLTLVGRELRSRLRDRTLIALSVVTPLFLAVVLSFGLGGTDTVDADVGIVGAPGPGLEALHQLLGVPEIASVFRRHDVADEQAAREQVRNGTLDTAIVLRSPAGGGPVEAIVFGGDDDLANDIAEAAAEAAATAADVSRALGVTEAAGPARGLPVNGSLGLRRAQHGGIDAAAFFGPSMAIAFLFFTAQHGARTLAEERRNGTLAVLATRTRLGLVLFAKAAATILLSVGTSVMVVATTSVLFGISWGSPVAAAGLLVAVGLAVSGVMSVITGSARDDRRADALATAVSFVLGLLGGHLTRIGGVPSVLEHAAMLTPNGTALQGFRELAVNGTALPSIVTLVIVGVTLHGAGLVLSARREVVA